MPFPSPVPHAPPGRARHAHPILSPSAAVALFALLAVGASAQPTSSQAGLAELIDGVLDARSFDDAYWGAYVVDLDTGRELYDRNGSRRFIPASNMKLLTTAAALDALGPGFRYPTRLYADGDVQNGTLLGSLVVRGSGDPTFGGRFRDGDLRAPSASGPTACAPCGHPPRPRARRGRRRHLRQRPPGPGLEWDDLEWYYGAEISGLQFGEGTVQVEVRGTTPGQPARIEVDAGLRLRPVRQPVHDDRRRRHPRGLQPRRCRRTCSR